MSEYVWFGTDEKMCLWNQVDIARVGAGGRVTARRGNHTANTNDLSAFGGRVCEGCAGIRERATGIRPTDEWFTSALVGG